MLIKTLLFRKVNQAWLLMGFIVFASLLKGSAVDSITAKRVATNFYTQQYKVNNPFLSLVYTERSPRGEPEYYVYNIVPKSGFVIVSAEDAGYPILGYSNEGYYMPDSTSPEFALWMQRYTKQIVYIRTNNVQATSDVLNEWNTYSNNVPLKITKQRAGSVNALIKTTWAQEPYYNAYCPGGTVAGCVATTMGQIMKYWSYPSHGLGSSSYTDSPYGSLMANYDTSHYDWTAMPLNVTRSNSQVAKLIYDCGVSVDMNYSPTSSGAYMISSDDPQNSGISAQTAFVQYFGYNRSTIQGLYMSNYTYSEWVALLENELNNNRPLFYAGSGDSGSHAWVCDGYNGIGDFHMNWGWAGYEDGYYNINALNPDNYPFNNGEEALIGIEPPSAVAYFSANTTIIRTGDTVMFTDNSLGFDTITSWQWSFPGGVETNSSVLTPSVKYDNPGTYNVSETVSTKRGDITLTKDNYIIVLDNNTVNVYPTLSDGNLTIQLHDAGLAGSNIKFSLYDMLGRKMYSTTLTQYITQVTVEVPYGMYFFRVFDASGNPIATGRLVMK